VLAWVGVEVFADCRRDWLLREDLNERRCIEELKPYRSGLHVESRFLDIVGVNYRLFPS
jgi:hypothetical protein